MKIGISSWAFPWAIGVMGREPANPMTPAQLLDHAVELDVPVVQIADNMPLHLLSEGELESLARQAVRQGLQLEVGTCGFLPKHLLDYLDIARLLGSPFLRVVIDSPEHEPAEDEILQTLARILPIADSYGIDLLVENHDRFTAHQLRDLIQRADNPRLGIVLDTVNSLGTLESVEEVLSVLGPWVRNVHIKDVSITRLDHRMGFLVHGAVAGSGNLDLDRLLSSLAKLDSEPNLILEQWPPAAETLETAIDREARWAAESIRYLKRQIARLNSAERPLQATNAV